MPWNIDNGKKQPPSPTKSFGGTKSGTNPDTNNHNGNGGWLPTGTPSPQLPGKAPENKKK